MKTQFENLLTTFKGLEFSSNELGANLNEDKGMNEDKGSIVSISKWVSQVSSFLQIVVNTLSDDQ